MTTVNLSPRERAVLILLARGHTLRSAGFELGLSSSTVKNNVDSAYKRLRVNNRADAWRLLGWLRPPEE